jgi:septum formation inhibitor MinC
MRSGSDVAVSGSVRGVLEAGVRGDTDMSALW